MIWVYLPGSWCSYYSPTILLWSSYYLPIIFLLYSYDLPIIFLWYSYYIPTIFLLSSWGSLVWCPLQSLALPALGIQGTSAATELVRAAASRRSSLVDGVTRPLHHVWYLSPSRNNYQYGEWLPIMVNNYQSWWDSSEVYDDTTSTWGKWTVCKYWGLTVQLMCWQHNSGHRPLDKQRNFILSIHSHIVCCTALLFMHALGPHCFTPKAWKFPKIRGSNIDARQ